MLKVLCFTEMSRKLLFVLLFSGVLLPSATLYASVQSGGKISLKMQDASLVNILEEFRKQSGYNFMYNEKYVKSMDRISLDIDDYTIEAAMKEILKNTGLEYKIQDNIIILQESRAIQTSSRRVKGIVKDDSGQIIPGATVLIEGTTIGVSTNIEGRFVLDLPAGASRLKVTFVGMEPKIVKLDEGAEDLVIVLQPQVDELDEVVITGYTRTTKEKTVGSVAVVKRDVFENKVVPTIDNLLQGVVAGVNVQPKSGRPGESAKIRIRGTSTITGNAEPLWVVDGVPLQNNIPKIQTSLIRDGDYNAIFSNGVGGVNPNDIENITILKNAAACALYGARAAGGVIVVTTKKGKIGKMMVNYSANVSVDVKPQRDMNLMNSREKIEWEKELWDEFSAKGYAQSSHYPVIGIVGIVRSGQEQFKEMSSAGREAYLEELKNTNTDWIDLLYRTAISQNHHLSLSGGKEGYTYYLSFGYSKDNGVIKTTDYDRYTINANVNLRPDERWNIRLGLDIASQGSNGPSMQVDPYKYTYFANPYEKPYHEDGTYAADNTYYTLLKVNVGRDPVIPANGFNVLRELYETSNETRNTQTSARLDVDFNITDKLMFSGTGSFSFTNDDSDNINGKDTYAAYQDRLAFDSGRQDRLYGSILQAAARNTSYSFKGVFSYHNVFAYDHSLSVLAGSEIQQEKAKSIFEKRYGYDPVTGNSSIPLPPRPTTGDRIDYDQVIAFGAAVDALSGQMKTEDRMASFYASLDYDFRTKYILGLSFRTDGSNNFGSDEQFNPNWSAGVGWHLAKEAFMEPLKPVLSTLSLKLSMGYTGTISKDAKPNLIMDYVSTFRKTDTESYRMGSISNPPNPHLRWEKKKDMTLTVDFGLFNNRITGLFEAYYSLTSDAVTSVNITQTTGFRQQSFNTSKLENRGLEGTLNIQALRGKDYSLNINVNVGWNRNKLKEYYSPTGVNYSDKCVGYPLNAIFGGKYTGIDPETGIYKFQLRPDAVITDKKDLVTSDNYYFYLGTGDAPVVGGFSVQGSYKGFSLSVSGTYKLGAHIINRVSSPVDASSLDSYFSGDVTKEEYFTWHNDLYTNHLNVRKEVVNRWTPENRTGVKYPRLIDRFGTVVGDNGEPLYLSQENPTSIEITNGALLENVSFLKLNTVTFSYTFSQKLLKRMAINSLSINASVQNILTVTNYSGIDPEAPGATYPQSRSASIGLSIGF